jgi:hypothetical protein
MNGILVNDSCRGAVSNDSGLCGRFLSFARWPCPAAVSALILGALNRACKKQFRAGLAHATGGLPGFTGKRLESNPAAPPL